MVSVKHGGGLLRVELDQSKVRESVKEKKVQKRYQEEFKREAVR
jgi:hypothetical protein